MKPYMVGIAFAGLILGGIIGVIFNTSNTPKSEVLAIIPAFGYPDLDGALRNSSEWQDKTLVLNFWAAWCPPCREETPMFIELQEKYAHDKVQFVGIAIDDKEPVQDFVDTYGVNYPILMGDIQAVTLSRKLGNRFEGLPYTVIAEPGGRIILRHTGGATREQIEPVLKEAIKKNQRL